MTTNYCESRPYKTEPTEDHMIAAIGRAKLSLPFAFCKQFYFHFPTAFDAVDMFRRATNSSKEISPSPSRSTSDTIALIAFPERKIWIKKKRVVFESLLEKGKTKKKNTVLSFEIRKDLRKSDVKGLPPTSLTSMTSWPHRQLVPSKLQQALAS